MPQSVRTAVAIPVKDEAERIAPCLRALALQSEVAPDIVLLLVNNTTDSTVAIVRELAPTLPVRIELIEHVFAPEQASAGAARRLAMERAAGLLGTDGVLLTTDADGRVPADWIATNLRHLRAGIDAVAGRVVLDPADAAAIPSALHADDALECAYAAALDEIAALLDPDLADPWPRHTQHSDASIAVTLEVYRRVGGMPSVPLAEDRRFFAALRAADARIRHAPEIEVMVSGRTVGRAEGGMADTIRRRLAAPDPYLDNALEPVADWVRRVRLRAQFRSAWHADRLVREALLKDLAPALSLSLETVQTAAGLPRYGMGWARLEAASPVLRRRLVPARDAATELARAERIRAELWPMLSTLSSPLTADARSEA